jgi:hypothetical protein
MRFWIVAVAVLAVLLTGRRILHWLTALWDGAGAFCGRVLHHLLQDVLSTLEGIGILAGFGLLCAALIMASRSTAGRRPALSATLAGKLALSRPTPWTFGKRKPPVSAPAVAVGVQTGTGQLSGALLDEQQPSPAWGDPDEKGDEPDNPSSLELICEVTGTEVGSESTRQAGARAGNGQSPYAAAVADWVPAGTFLPGAGLFDDAKASVRGRRVSRRHGGQFLADERDRTCDIGFASLPRPRRTTQQDAFRASRPRTTRLDPALIRRTRSSANPHLELARRKALAANPPQKFLLMIVGSRGVQVGQDNRQTNIYSYLLNTRRLDVTAVLRKSGVVQALKLALANPEDPKLREGVVAALGKNRCRFFRHDTINFGKPDQDRLPRSVSAELATIEGTIIISKCRGVQLGNSNKQNNTFNYIYRNTTVDIVQLAEQVPAVAITLANLIIDGNTSARTRDLDNALVNALEAYRPPPPAGVRRPALASKVVTGVDGYQAGPHSTATSIHVVNARFDLDKHLKDAVRHTQRFRAQALRYRERHRIPSPDTAIHESTATPSRDISGMPAHRKCKPSAIPGIPEGLQPVIDPGEDRPAQVEDRTARSRRQAAIPTPKPLKPKRTLTEQDRAVPGPTSVAQPSDSTTELPSHLKDLPGWGRDFGMGR